MSDRYSLLEEDTLSVFQGFSKGLVRPDPLLYLIRQAATITPWAVLMVAKSVVERFSGISLNLCGFLGWVERAGSHEPLARVDKTMAQGTMESVLFAPGDCEMTRLVLVCVAAGCRL